MIKDELEERFVGQHLVEVESLSVPQRKAEAHRK